MIDFKSEEEVVSAVRYRISVIENFMGASFEKKDLESCVDATKGILSKLIIPCSKSVSQDVLEMTFQNLVDHIIMCQIIHSQHVSAIKNCIGIDKDI